MPTAGPWTAATTGFSARARRAAPGGRSRAARGGCPACRRRRASSAASLRSAPEEKPLPAPRISTARTEGSAARSLQRVTQLAPELLVPGVHGLGAVQGDAADPAVLLATRSSRSSWARKLSSIPCCSTRSSGSGTRVFASGQAARPSTSTPTGCPRRARGRPDPGHPRALRPLQPAGHRAAVGRSDVAGGARRGGRAREGTRHVDRARAGAGAGALPGRGGGRPGCLQHVQARPRGPGVPSRARRASWAST